MRELVSFVVNHFANRMKNAETRLSLGDELERLRFRFGQSQVFGHLLAFGECNLRAPVAFIVSLRFLTLGGANIPAQLCTSNCSPTLCATRSDIT